MNVLDAVTEAATKLLYETIHGNSIAPGIISTVEQRKILIDFCRDGKFYLKTIKGKTCVQEFSEYLVATVERAFVGGDLNPLKAATAFRCGASPIASGLDPVSSTRTSANLRSPS